jgi:hypothetical protein
MDPLFERGRRAIEESRLLREELKLLLKRRKYLRMLARLRLAALQSATKRSERKAVLDDEQ